MKKSILVFLFASFLSFSGCATYEALTGKNTDAAGNTVDRITTAGQSDLQSIAPIVTAINPIAGVAVEGLAGILAVVGALFGIKQKRNAANATTALATVAAAINKIEKLDPALAEKIKGIVAHKSSLNGTAHLIDKTVQNLPQG